MCLRSSILLFALLLLGLTYILLLPTSSSAQEPAVPCFSLCSCSVHGEWPIPNHPEEILALNISAEPFWIQFDSRTTCEAEKDTECNKLCEGSPPPEAKLRGAALTSEAGPCVDTTDPFEYSPDSNLEKTPDGDIFLGPTVHTSWQSLLQSIDTGSESLLDFVKAVESFPMVGEFLAAVLMAGAIVVILKTSGVVITTGLLFLLISAVFSTFNGQSPDKYQAELKKHGIEELQIRSTDSHNRTGFLRLRGSEKNSYFSYDDNTRTARTKNGCSVTFEDGEIVTEGCS